MDEYFVLLEEKQAQIAALERELAETKVALAAKNAELEVTQKAVNLLAERLGGTGYACVRGCSYWTPDDKKTCIRPMDGSCADGVKAGALAEARKQEKARKEQEEANASRNASEDEERYGDDCSG